ncbi:MAG: hypothetical protein GY801_39290 [bacterium]|nr:hypothetical protein [bacterium]
MKRSYHYLYLLGSILWLLSGCGKKGDPSVPIVPHPLPVSGVSAHVFEDGVVLEWNPPTAYDTEKVLDLEDIKYFSIFRKIEPPLDKGWTFDRSSEGWTAAGQSFVAKQYKGVLRTTSEQKILTVLSQEELLLDAAQHRFIRLKLWTKNVQQGYLAFITDADKRWDKNTGQKFEPAVHSSYYAVHQAFNSSKLKRFPIRSSAASVVQEYIIDMRSIPAWQGVIQQIGLILQNTLEDEELVELGLDSVEFIGDIDAPTSTYKSVPWIFLDDEEGWQALPAESVSGAAQGVFYAENSGPLILLSAPGQRIQFTDISKLQVRMKVTAGNEAYLIVRQGGERLFRSAKEITGAVSQGIRIPLKASSDFSTYTLDLSQYVEALTPIDSAILEEAQVQPETIQDAQTDEVIEEEIPESGRLEKQAYFTQIGFVFPAVAATSSTRQVLIDYIDILPEDADPELNASRLAQRAIPSDDEIAWELHSKVQEKRATFELPYETLPEEQEQAPLEKFLLAEISPSDPAPAEIKEEPFVPVEAEELAEELVVEGETGKETTALGYEDPYSGKRFVLTDLGQFVVEDENGEEITAALEYGNRYSYEIEVTDRKKRKSSSSEIISIEFIKPPSPPENVRAEAGDEEVTLSWSSPVLGEDGKKIQNLTAYHIFRATSPGEYEDTPFNQVPASQTQFIDSAVTNRETYYYVIQALASQLPGAGSGKPSAEVSAVPLDTSAPEAPGGLVGVYLDDKVNLHWNQVLTVDFAGFNVYRSDSRDGDFQKLNDELLRKASFTDTAAKAKKRYYYYVTALDDEVPPNESEPSEIEPLETYPLN